MQTTGGNFMKDETGQYQTVAVLKDEVKRKPSLHQSYTFIGNTPKFIASAEKFY